MPYRGRRPIAEPADATGTPVPRLLAGVEPLGEYQGSGLTDGHVPGARSGGRVVQMSRLLHLVLSGIDGRARSAEIAAHVSAEFGRTVSTGNVEYLLDHKLAPLGLLGPRPTGPGPADPAGPGRAGAQVPLHPDPEEAGVQFFAACSGPCSPAVVVVALGGLIVSDVWLFRAGQLDPRSSTW